MSMASQTRSGLSLALFLLTFAGVCAAQEPAARKVTEIVRASSPPILDGRLNEAVWAEATVITDLHQYDPVDHGEPSETSIFYILYDDDNL